MTTADCIPALCGRTDDAMQDEPHHSPAALAPRELVSMGLRPAIKGGGMRPCSRWLQAHHRARLPTRPERPRLLRRWRTHPDGTDRFLASPTRRGVLDPHGRERIPPVRAGRRAGPSGQKGLSHDRGLVGGKLCRVLNRRGLVGAGDGATAHVYDATCHPLSARCKEQRGGLGDTGFHRAEGDPPHRKLGQRREGNERRLGETVRSMLTGVCPRKTRRHRVWGDFKCRRAYRRAAFNLRVQGQGRKPDAQGVVRLSLAQFAL